MEKYFLKYEAEEAKEYQVPEELRKSLVSIDGVNILHEANAQPVVILEMPKDKVKEVESLEGVVKLYENLKFEPVK